ncbi:UBC-like protein [Ascodesmis nigricans]|uniref:UBC-like protein n=1 Tax=Ascodesmis nigricans TaxID=341454 RepID=A0A4S2MS71_9PEZI|nr:UBC-like protein [Ascodesmis nigricans]
MSTFAAKRLQKEMAKIHQGLAPGIFFVNSPNLQHWQMDIQVLDSNPLYAGKTFRLNFRFSNNYPIEAPEVTFIRAPDREIPMHPHIYSNGIICLDLLSSGNGWSPVQSVESVCMSIQSMLTGNTKNERPEGDEAFVLREGRSVRDIRFVYDDPTV